jgi:hypothetical protein
MNKQKQEVTIFSKKSKWAMEAHPTSYSMDKVFFRENKTAGKWGWPHTSK